LDVTAGDVVTLGTLRLVNGTAVENTWIDGLNLQITVTGGFNEVLDIPITAVNTICLGGEPQDVCADYIYFTDETGFGSFRVWEGFFGVAEVRGQFGSLDLAGFGDVTGVGFADVFTGELGQPFDPDTLPPTLQAGFIYPSVAPIPEPGTLLLLGVGLAIGALKQRQRKI